MSSEANSQDQHSQKKRSWIFSIGPGLVTACVVIGPGSILTSSKVGATDGYSKSWVVVLAVIFMLTFTTLGAKLAVVSQQSNGDLVRKHAGRWLAILIGLSVFFISAGFQFGNNLGVHAAIATYVDGDYWVILFNAVALAFVFGFKNLYSALEKLMTGFVGLMLVSFAVNLFFAKPAVGELAAGFVPSGLSEIGLPLLGLVGTTFVISAAYYQSYLVRFKGWQIKDLKSGMVDARVSAIIMALITLMLMTTAAAVLRGKELTSPADVANSLYPLFGEKGRVIFSLGLFSAAFSSFIVNSMIGGFILSDGFNLGSTPNDKIPRIMTGVVLVTGMGVALYAIKAQVSPVAAIVAAQAAVVIASPVVAGTLLWLTNRKDIMGDYKNSMGLNAIAGIGFVLLLAMAYNTAVYKFYPMLLNFVGTS
jgi:NRAMP (natural resistance-associated macrophage protein)-like metal ion transporter